MRPSVVVFAVLSTCLCVQVHAQKRFIDLVGPVQVAPVKNKPTTEVGYLSWGGDEAFFLANGGLDTSPNSIYGRNGLKLKFVDGNDFIGQVRRCLSGETPFLRGTTAQIGMASEAFAQAKLEEVSAVVILQTGPATPVG